MDYSVSYSTSTRALARDDIAGSRAHVRGLGRGGLLDEEEVPSLLDALDQVEAELDGGTFVVAPDDEDIHTAVERRVTELAGDVGAQAPHRPEPQRPGGDRPPALHARRARARSRHGPRPPGRR